MKRTLAAIVQQIERQIIGRLPEALRANMWIESASALLFGCFYAGAIGFMPVVLRQLGATPDMLAIYVALTYLGFVFSPLSVRLMRGRRMTPFFLICRTISRGIFLLAFCITQAWWMLALTGLYWFFESFPGPAYTRIVQEIYPNPYRGRALAVVRFSMVLALLIATPLAGWALDRLGHRLALPIASVIGLAATLLFNRLRFNDTPVPVATGRAEGIWRPLFTDRRFALFLAGMTCYGLGFLIGSPLFAIVQVDRLHLSYTTIGLLSLVQSIFWLIGNTVWGWLLDRRGSFWVVKMNIAVAMIVPFTYMLAVNEWTLLPAFIANGIISAGFDIGLISTSIDLARPGKVAEYSALQATVLGIRGAIAPFLGTLAIGLGLSYPVVFGLGVAFIAIGWLILVRGTTVAERSSAA